MFEQLGLIGCGLMGGSFALALKRAGLVKRVTLPIKILGNGELKKPITVQAHKFSKSAEAKIQAAGGSIEVIPGV